MPIKEAGETNLKRRELLLDERRMKSDKEKGRDKRLTRDSEGELS